jgi:hypothetical protein
MKRSSGPRKTAELSNSLHHQLSMYALAAGAAGVSMLSLAQSAEARVIYTPAHKWLPINRYFYLDLNHDGVNDFRFLLGSSSGPAGYYRALAVEWTATSQAENAVYSVLSQNRHCVAALPKGTKVGPKSRGLRSQLRTGDLFYKVFGSDFKRSYCRVAKQAYVGLQFAIKGKVHYGWARLGYIRTGPHPKAELIGYAYETIPNKSPSSLERPRGRMTAASNNGMTLASVLL